MRTGAILMVTAMLVAACSGDDEAASPPSTTTTTTAAAAMSTTTEPVPTGPREVDRIVVTGPEELVFDWTTDRSAPDHLPDISPRAFRDVDDTVHLLVSNLVSYQMLGPSLDEVAIDCDTAIMQSDYDPDPAQFNDSEWIGSTFTEDGATVYGVVHNEYRGDTHDAVRPGQCPSSDRFPCLDTSFTMVVSRDGGYTFDDIAPAPGHLIYTLPYQFDDEGQPTGLRQPSNIVTGPDGAFYLFGNLSDYPEVRDDPEPQWVCALRTEDLEDPASWRFWNGASFDGVVTDPYRDTATAETETCQPLAPQLGLEMYETVVYNEPLERYVMMGYASDYGLGDPKWGIYYSLSEDLLEWTPRELLFEMAANSSVADNVTDTFNAYLSIIDPDSESRSFETMDDDAYLYFIRYNFGGGSLDRDILRMPIAVRTVEVPRPEWTFDTDGDTEGWVARNGLVALDVRDGALVTAASGDDPYFAVNGIRIAAEEFDTLTITMSATGGGRTSGEIFFTTDTIIEPGNDTYVPIPEDIVLDGIPRDYVVDLSNVRAWAGVITSLRIDPVAEAGPDIEIDAITVR